MKYHLYVCPQDSLELWRHVSFRDYFNQHEYARLEYERIKLDVKARSGGERNVYVDIKENEGTFSAFVESVLAKARQI